jgi:hypothetical protein
LEIGRSKGLFSFLYLGIGHWKSSELIKDIEYIDFFPFACFIGLWINVMYKENNLE